MTDEITIGYKLFRQRLDGTFGPLFINKKQKLVIGEWYESEAHPTKGYAFRPGWHSLLLPIAPHLSEKNRVWCEVLLRGVELFERPVNQGGKWFLAKHLKISKVI